MSYCVCGIRSRLGHLTALSTPVVKVSVPSMKEYLNCEYARSTGSRSITTALAFGL
jgi:hypothetical protein